MSAPDVSIVLPLHQQADHVEAIIADYVQALAALASSYELILVVNGSTDHTAAVCHAAAARWPQVIVLEVAEAGWGRAVRLGLSRARGGCLCYTNSARTTAADLVRLIHLSVVSPDVVIKANRKIRDNWRRRVGSLLFALECRALFDLANWDINGTPKVFSRQFDRLLRLERDNMIDLEFAGDLPAAQLPDRRGAGVFEQPPHGAIDHELRLGTPSVPGGR